MILVEDVSVRVGSFALDGIRFEIPTGQYGVLMGRTGCGKTTILEAVCGLKAVVEGRILLMGQDVTGLRPAERGIGFVPQDGALFSTLTVQEHLAFALKVRRYGNERVKGRVLELAQLLGVTSLLHRKPQGLSGGEKQRVALGRALSFEPDVLCLDEPLSALDESTREEMCGLLSSVQKATGVTTLHITHSLWEARQLADKIFFMEDGAVKAMPVEKEEKPRSFEESPETPGGAA